MRPRTFALPALLALTLGLSTGLSTEAQAQFWLYGDGGPAYRQAGFTQSQMKKYARTELFREEGQSTEQAIASSGIDPTTYELIAKAVRTSPAIRMSANQIKMRLKTAR
ncbi:hypothetical protein [Pseudooceanicola sp. HF7]|uniref:hypothetical protein n=1 Tax=Pseudooceanicola sp. HF7 TaxID=2721560 RepID=UPI0014320380|nr:hypothetical protein [Pseudooceanicola sp. HF7]NIZ11741.1 hypothetical protein [Pseudooceanicola sp. HF7]